MLNDQQGHKISKQEKIKGRWKVYTQNLQKSQKDDRYLRKDSYEEEPIILESEVKAALKLLGRQKSPGIDEILIQLFQNTETEPVKILTRILKPN